jgi:hypothetical protein
MKYKLRAVVTDDLGQCSLFLLLLTVVMKLALYSWFKFVKYLVVGGR